MSERGSGAPQQQAAQLLERAIERRVFPAAVAEVGSSAGVIWREAFGSLWYPRMDAGASRIEREVPRTSAETIFDLASLTKPISTAAIALALLHAGAFSLDDPVGRFFAEWRGADREHVTLRDLFEHASGLPARLVDRPPSTRREFEHEICASPLEYPPRSKSVYSDLDFILLGFLLADAGGATLSPQFTALWQVLSPDTRDVLGFAAAETVRLQALGIALPVAPTKPLEEDARKGRVLTGEVHDNYAAALGGQAGHAGLFGNAPGAGRFARAMLRAARGDAQRAAPFSPELVQLATRKSAVPGSSRALGWDTMLPTSSCGTRLSSAAFGHVGFTGTSLWIDPAIDRYFVLLTNRAYGGGTLEEMREVRRAFHDILAGL